MNGIMPVPDVVLDVIVRLGRTHVLAVAPSRLQVLVETRPSAQTRHIKAPADIRFVVDVSGSMGEPSTSTGATKLEVVKEALIRVLRELDSLDSVLLSVFSTDGRLVIPMTRLSLDARRRVQTAVQELQPESDTNISAGLALALEPFSALDTLPRVILFTDGRSSYPGTDHQRLVELADTARSNGIPLSIYGTGPDYSWSLLQQVAIRAGGGSFLKHVMDVQTLEGHMLAELAFLRGTAIERFEIEGRTPEGVSLVGVTSMMPQIRQLHLETNSFWDPTGALDLHRGAQYLIELEVSDPTAGQADILSLTFRGRNRSTRERFEQNFRVRITFVEVAVEQSRVDEQVRKILLMLAAAKQAEAGAYEKAAGFYQRAGEDMLAGEMRTLTQMTEADPESVRRHASSVAYGTVTASYTVNPDRVRGRH